MATTKVTTAIWSGQSLSAGGGPTTSSVVALDDSYGSNLSIKLTNGATGPTTAAQIAIEVSGDNSEYYNVMTVAGKTGNSEVAEWGMIPIHSGVSISVSPLPIRRAKT